MNKNNFGYSHLSNRVSITDINIQSRISDTSQTDQTESNNINYTNIGNEFGTILITQLLNLNESDDTLISIENATVNSNSIKNKIQQLSLYANKQIQRLYAIEHKHNCNMQYCEQLINNFRNMQNNCLNYDLQQLQPLQYIIVQVNKKKKNLCNSYSDINSNDTSSNKKRKVCSI